MWQSRQALQWPLQLAPQLQEPTPLGVHILINIEKGEVGFLEEVLGLMSGLEEANLVSFKDLDHSFSKITLKFCLSF